jgi:hypothetical protein
MTDPSQVTEFFIEQSSLEDVLADSASLAKVYLSARSLQANPERLQTFKVQKRKPTNIRDTQSEGLITRLGLSSWGQLSSQVPFHAFLSELTILHQGDKLPSTLYPGLLGKVCGLLKADEDSYSCVGLGVVRDLNLDSDLISIVTTADLNDVVGLAVASGEDTLELPLEAFWSDKAQHTSEVEQDFVFDDAVLVHKISRHHPGRSYLA